MDLFISNTPEALSQLAVKNFLGLMQVKERPLVCVASGDTPAGLYKLIVDKTGKKEIEIAGWNFIGLDEWAGMNENDEGSCRYHLNKQLFAPCRIQPERISFLNGKATDTEKECLEAESFIAANGGIDVAILGLGLNGHVGMNEPGTSPHSSTHFTALDPLTAATGQKYFKQKQHLSGGLTLGLGTLMKAKNIMLLVTGAHKATIIKKVIEEGISEQIPASLLRGHPALHIYLDAAAAKLLQQ